jgi:hypothetical protein
MLKGYRLGMVGNLQSFKKNTAVCICNLSQGLSFSKAMSVLLKTIDEQAKKKLPAPWCAMLVETDNCCVKNSYLCHFFISEKRAKCLTYLSSLFGGQLPQKWHFVSAENSSKICFFLKNVLSIN